MLFFTCTRLKGACNTVWRFVSSACSLLLLFLLVYSCFLLGLLHEDEAALDESTGAKRSSVELTPKHEKAVISPAQASKPPSPFSSSSSSPSLTQRQSTPASAGQAPVLTNTRYGPAGSALEYALLIFLSCLYTNHTRRSLAHVPLQTQ